MVHGQAVRAGHRYRRGRPAVDRRQLVKARTYVEGANAAGIVFGYFGNIEQDGSHWYFAKMCAAGVIPTNGGHCVFAAVPARRSSLRHFGAMSMRGFLQVLEANSPGLRANVERGSLIGRLRGFGGAQGYLRQCHGCGMGARR